MPYGNAPQLLPHDGAEAVGRTEDRDTDYLADNCYRAFGNLTEYLPKGFEYEFRALPAMPAVLDLLRSACQTITDGVATPRMQSMWTDLFTIWCRPTHG